MKLVIKLITCLLITAILFLNSCQKEYSCEDCIGNNHPPLAVAGPDTVITLPTDSVLLNGGKSSDPDGKISAWQWTKISGPSSSNITNANVAQTQVIDLVQGVYQFELKVTDADGLFATDTVQVTVRPTDVIVVGCNGIVRPQVNAQLIPISTLSQTRTDVAVASAGNKILYAGGFEPNSSNVSSRVDIYDAVTNTWTTAELSIARGGLTTAVLGNKIFFAGGYDQSVFGSSSRVDIYDAIADTWTTAELSLARGSMAGAAAGNKVLFAGGFNWGNVTSDLYPTIVDIYDASTNSWSASSLTDRPAGTTFGIAATVIGNKIYFAGASNDWPGWDLGKTSSTVNIYDVSTNTWSNFELSVAKGSTAAIAVGNKNYWAGGKISGQPPSQYLTNQVEIKDVNSGTSSFGCLFQPNAGFFAKFDALLKNNKIIFFTGAGAEKNKFDIYDIATNTWSIGVLSQNIENAAIISVNNTIYVAGGLVNGVLSNQVWNLEF